MANTNICIIMTCSLLSVVHMLRVIVVFIRNRLISNELLRTEIYHNLIRIIFCNRIIHNLIKIDINDTSYI